MMPGRIFSGGRDDIKRLDFFQEHLPGGRRAAVALGARSLKLGFTWHTTQKMEGEHLCDIRLKLWHSSVSFF
jgi:hypothetical protein